MNNFQKQMGHFSNAPKSNSINKTPSVSKQTIKKKIQINTNLEPSQSKKQF